MQIFWHTCTMPHPISGNFVASLLLFSVLSHCALLRMQAELLVPRTRTVSYPTALSLLCGWSDHIVWPRLGWERSCVDFLEGALYKTAVIRIIINYYICIYTCILLKPVLKSAARCIARLLHFSHISAFVADVLPWLPVTSRIQCKVPPLGLSYSSKVKLLNSSAL